MRITQQKVIPNPQQVLFALFHYRHPRPHASMNEQKVAARERRRHAAQQ
jgi:hypothetical protein